VVEYLLQVCGETSLVGIEVAPNCGMEVQSLKNSL